MAQIDVPESTGHIHPCTVHQSPQIRPMNDIKTIEELRAYHERLKGVVMALKRLEERTKNQRVKPPTSPRF